jgi:hypothetical protein
MVFSNMYVTPTTLKSELQIEPYQRCSSATSPLYRPDSWVLMSTWFITKITRLVPMSQQRKGHSRDLWHLGTGGVLAHCYNFKTQFSKRGMGVGGKDTQTGMLLQFFPEAHRALSSTMFLWHWPCFCPVSLYSTNHIQSIKGYLGMAIYLFPFSLSWDVSWCTKKRKVDRQVFWCALIQRKWQVTK